MVLPTHDLRSKTPLLKSSESTDIHGALLTLSEIAVAYREGGPDYDTNGLEVGHLLLISLSIY